MIRETIYEYEGKKKLAKGIRILCETLSMEGRILLNGHFTYSALEVAKKIESRDLWENQGIRMAAEVIAEINSSTGCGSASAAKMMLELLEEGKRRTAAGMNPVKLAEDITKAALELTKMVEEIAHPAEDSLESLVEEVVQVPETARLIAAGLERGEVVVKESLGLETRLEIKKGLALDTTPLCGKKGVFGQVSVLVTDGVLSSFTDILPVLEQLGDTPLLLVAQEITGEALTLLQTNVRQQRIQVWAVKAPGIGRRKEDLLGDLAAFTHTKVIPSFHLTEKSFSLKELGVAERLEVKDNNCMVCGDYHSPEMGKRMEQIRERIQAPSTNYYDQQILRERFAVLSGEVPVLYAGGITLTQAKEEKLRMEYAVAYGQTVQKNGMASVEPLLALPAKTPGMECVQKAMGTCFAGKEQSAWLLKVTISKISSMIAMWLTTGAVLVSTTYDREDRALIKSGVDIDRLRG